MIFASNNPGKLREIKKIFAEYDVKSLKEAGIEIEVEEDRDTFCGNALKKAQEIYQVSREAVIADDSGLCIHCYDEWPGVQTHRFLGENKTDDERNRAILDKMEDQKEREASVVCNLVYFDGKNTIVGEGKLEGTIAREVRGENGFGFDPIFTLQSGKTLAELTPEEKNLASARYLAAFDLKDKLEKAR